MQYRRQYATGLQVLCRTCTLYLPIKAPSFQGPADELRVVSIARETFIRPYTTSLSASFRAVVTCCVRIQLRIATASMSREIFLAFGNTGPFNTLQPRSLNSQLSFRGSLFATPSQSFTRKISRLFLTYYSYRYSQFAAYHRSRCRGPA